MNTKAKIAFFLVVVSLIGMSAVLKFGHLGFKEQNQTNISDAVAISEPGQCIEVVKVIVRRDFGVNQTVKLESLTDQGQSFQYLPVVNNEVGFKVFGKPDKEAVWQATIYQKTGDDLIAVGGAEIEGVECNQAVEVDL